METTTYKTFQKLQKGQANTFYDIYPVIDETGDWKVLTDKDVIINSIKTLLLTPLGRYPFDPQFGSLLYKQIFELSDTVTQDIIKYEVTDRIEMYNDKVKVKDVKIFFDTTNKVCRLDVYIKILSEETMSKISVFMDHSASSMFGSVSDTEDIYG